MVGAHGLMVTVVPTSLRSAALRLKNKKQTLFAEKTHHINLSYVPKDIETRYIPNSDLSMCPFLIV